MLDLRQSIALQLEPYQAYLGGEILSSLLLVKGLAGPAEQAGGAPLSGEDGEALRKALCALGWPDGSWTNLLLEPVAPQGARPLDAEGLRLVCEIIDPHCLIALDERARQAVVEAFADAELALTSGFWPGAQMTVLGRSFVSVDGFEAALGDADAKQRVWAQLKQAVPLAPLD